MRTLLTALAVIVLAASLAAPLRADEDCDNVVKALEDALAVSAKGFDETMAQLKRTMSQGGDDKTKASVKNTFCSVVGEMLGTSRAARAVAAECSAAQRPAFASLDKSIQEIETAIDNTCK
jgi:hypothetical protein